MSSEIQQLIRRLREAEDHRHAASLQAIDTLEENMIGSGAPATEKPPPGGPDQTHEQGVAENGKEKVAGNVSNVDRVLSALDTQDYRSIEEIMGLTGLDEVQVRSALYARAVQSRIRKRKDKKKPTTFRKATGPAPLRSRTSGVKGQSAADRVRAVLMQHPNGLRAREIREKLPDIAANTIGATLYNMKNKSKKAVYDESSQTYRLRPMRDDGKGALA